MKNIVLPVITILIVALCAFCAGCSSYAGVDTELQGTQSEGISEIMQSIPNSTWCVAVGDMHAIYDIDRQFLDDSSNDIGIRLLEYLGINLQDVTSHAFILPFGPWYYLGEFDFDDLRGSIPEGSTRNDQAGIEVYWDDPMWIILHENLIVFGTDAGGDYSDSCIKTLTGEVESLYDDADFRDIMDDFPRGMFFNLCRGTQSDYEGLKVTGQSITTEGETLRVVTFYKFEDAATAEKNRYNLAEVMAEEYDEFEEHYGLNVKTDMSRIDGYVQSILEIGIDDYLNLKTQYSMMR